MIQNFPGSPASSVIQYTVGDSRKGFVMVFVMGSQSHRKVHDCRMMLAIRNMMAVITYMMGMITCTIEKNGYTIPKDHLMTSSQCPLVIFTICDTLDPCI